jgi:DNA repair protein RadC
MKQKTIARLEVLRTDDVEAFTIVVRRADPYLGFEVFVDGGLLSTGEESYITGNVAIAMARAAQEAAVALQGGNRTTVRTEDPPPYGLDKPERKGDDDALIANAITLVRGRLKSPKNADVLTSIRATKDLARLQFGGLPHEAFGVLWFNGQNQLLEDEVMFRGSLMATSVYPREVVKAAMQHNAAAAVFIHNHPSGSVAPSRADEHLTKGLQAALLLVDVRVLDHLIVGGGTGDVFSFAENGLL